MRGYWPAHASLVAIEKHEAARWYRYKCKPRCTLCIFILWRLHLRAFTQSDRLLWLHLGDLSTFCPFSLFEFYKYGNATDKTLRKGNRRVYRKSSFLILTLDILFEVVRKELWISFWKILSSKKKLKYISSCWRINYASGHEYAHIYTKADCKYLGGKYNKLS